MCNRLMKWFYKYTAIFTHPLETACIGQRSQCMHTAQSNSHNWFGERGQIKTRQVSLGYSYNEVTNSFVSNIYRN